MERQETEPLLSDEEFTLFLNQNQSLVMDLIPVSLEYPSFDPLQQSSDKCNNSDDKQLQQQQIPLYQNQQRILMQQQQEQDQLQRPHLMLNNLQNGQKNINVSQQMTVATMKRENIDCSGISLLHSDSLSSTPPEMLLGVPYSAVHSFTSDALNGNMAHQYSAASAPPASSSSQAFYNQTNAYCTDSYMPSAFYSQNSYGASLQNRAAAHNTSQFEPMQQNQVSQMNNSIPGMFQSNSDTMAIISTRSQGNPASGCTTLTLQKQVEVFQNVPLSHVAELNCPSNFTNNYNMNNNLSNNTYNSYTVPQTQDSCSDLLYPPVTTFNNHSAAGSTSNCGSSKFPEPFSPATLETTDVIAIFDEDTGIPHQVEQQRHLVALHDIQEKKFVPREQKFISPVSGNEIMLRAEGCEGVLGGITPGLTRAKTIDVTTLNNWPGEYNFQIKVVPNDKQKNKWCYSSKVHRLYCNPMLAAEVQVSVNNWMEVAFHDAKVRLVAVYQDAQHRTKPVQRCHNCKKSDKTSKELMEHLVQVSNSGAVHSVTGSRYTVSVPMVRSHLGEDSVTLLICCTCMSSCVGGPNRRPFALLFSLIMNGEEKGRQVLSTKCCKGPNRDIKKDEADHERQLGLVVENSSNATSADPGVECSPKKPNLAIAGSSGLNVATFSPKSATGKRKSAVKNLLVSGDIFSSDSETDRSSSKKNKLGNSSGVGRGTAAIPEGFTTLVIPADFKNDVVKYVDGLFALRYVRHNKLNVQKGSELP